MFSIILNIHFCKYNNNKTIICYGIFRKSKEKEEGLFTLLKIHQLVLKNNLYSWSFNFIILAISKIEVLDLLLITYNFNGLN